MDVPRSQHSILRHIEFIPERDFVLLLIQLYRESPALWKVKSKDYTNKTKRNQAVQKIVSVLKKYRPDFNEEKLKKKINILRTNFNKECQKLQRSKEYGESSDGLAEPTLWYFNDMFFIKSQTEIDDNDDCEQLLVERTLSPSQIASPSPMSSPSLSSPVLSTPLLIERGAYSYKKLKRSSSSSIEQTDIPSQQYSKSTEYEAKILAKTWAIKLARLAPDQRLFAEKIINDTLFEAELGTLTRNGVSFLTSSAQMKASYPDPLS